MQSTKRPSERQLRSELKRAQARVGELEETVKAIQNGEVDAVVVDGPHGSQIFTLRGPEEPYRILAEGMSEGAAMLSADGTILFCNQRLAEMAGLPSERLLGAPLASILREEDRGSVPEWVGQASEGNVRTESGLLSRGGATLPVQMSLSSIPLDGTGQGVCLIATDLREQKRGEEANLRLASIVNSTEDAIIGKTVGGIVTSWNTGAEVMYGYFAHEMVGQPIAKAIPPDRLSEFQTILEKVKQGQHVRHCETVRLRKGGRQISVSLTVSPVKDKAGNIVGVSTIARDITESKRAERELRASELRIRLLLDSTAEAIYGEDLDGNCTFCNNATARLLGYDCSADLFGKNMHALMHHSQPDGVAISLQDCPVTKAIRAGRDYHSEDLVFWRANGTCFHAECWSHSLLAEGRPNGAVVTFLDISERKQVEEKLRIASLYTRNIIEASLDPLVTISREGKIIDVNAATEKVTGVSRESLIGSDFSNYFTDPESARRGYEKVFAQGAVQDYPLAIRGTAGTVTDVLYNATVFKNEAGEVAGVFAAARDVTERKRAEQEIRKLNQELEGRVQQRTAQLQESETRVRRKLESILSPEGDLGSLELADLLDIPAVQSLADDVYQLAQIPMFILDLKGRVMVSVGWQEICTKFHRTHPEACKNCEESDRELSQGVAPGQFKLYKCKNNLWDVVTPIMLGEQQVGNLFSGQFFFSDETVDHELFRSQARRYGFDGPQYLAALERVPRLSRAEVETSMKFYTKLAQLLSQLNYGGIQLARSMTETGRANAELAASVKELEAFTYSVSHDLRAPLRHISGFSKILSEEFGANLPDDAQRHLQRIEDGTRRMGQLVDDLLNLARVGRRDLSLRVSGLKSLVDEVIGELAPEYANRQIEWKIGDLPLVECDPGLMKQVFQNLISNALKFTRPRPRAVIEIAGQRDEHGSPVVFVRDNGVGFNIKYADKLFGVFQRLHRAEDFEGTGVGLATVQRIVQKHGGRIWVEAELDKGATFYFTLGISETTEAKTKAAIAGDQA